MSFLKFAVITLLLLLSANAFAIEPQFIVKLNSGHSANDQRHLYNWEVLGAALDASKARFGPYQIKVTGDAIPNHQRLKFLKEGKHLNVAMSLTNLQWEQEAIPIRIPIRRGIFSYRLLMVNQNVLEKFKSIRTLEQLKSLKVGVRKSWTTRLILKHLDFNTVDAYSYNSLFAMLDKGRFDYVPRGINEIYVELDVQRQGLKNIDIEPNLALYIPSPYYVFVSPLYPKLAERLEFGLLEIVDSGKLAEIFDKSYGQFIQQAELHKRHIINIGNPLMPENTPFDNKKFWHDFNLAPSQP